MNLKSENRGNKFQELSAQQNVVFWLLHKQLSAAHAVRRLKQAVSHREGPRWWCMFTAHGPCTQAKLFISGSVCGF